jgi:hypothetical protein
MTAVFATSGSLLILPLTVKRLLVNALQRTGHAAPLILSLQVKAWKSLTIAPDWTFNAPAFLRGNKTMVIETILFLAFVVAVGAAIVKIYEWRQDVLYGPYLAKQRSKPNRPR